MATVQLVAQDRPVGRRAYLTQVRASGGIPAVLYGHGEPRPIQVPRREFQRILERHGSGGVFELILDGAPQPALLKEIDRHPVTDEIVNLGFQRVALTETVHARVPVALTGRDAVIARRGVVQSQLDAVEVECRAVDVPAVITVDLSGLEPGDVIRAGDLPLPEGVMLASTVDPEQVVVTISGAAVPATEEEALAAQEAETATEAA